VLNAIGGRGLEFFVDDRNYDEGGKVHEKVKNRAAGGPEPGAWRLEVSPAQDAKEDLFLVVLLPTVLGAKPSAEVRYLESGNRVGVEISTPARTARWWFEQGRNGAEVQVITGSDTRTHVLRADSAPPPPPRGWLARLKEAP
jgi:hypothetical protein